MNRFVAIGTLFATALAAWLRLHGLGGQVVVDDEWHAIHKLMSADVAGILTSFGVADHSIPLTLLYKAMAATIGLDEIDMRLPQAACGIALVPLCAWLAWRATRDEAAAVLLAFLVAVAPFLVFYSRFARPYAITTLIAVAALGALWRWRERRDLRLGIAICVMVAIGAWFLSVSSLFAAAAILYILGEDLASSRPDRRARIVATVALGAGAFAAILALLAAPLLADWHALGAKVHDATPGAYTLFRVLGIFGGGVSDALVPFVAAITAFGAWRLVRRERALGLYLLWVGFVPLAVVMLLRAPWTQYGHTLARYVFPLQAIVLGWFAFGAMELARALPERLSERRDYAAAFVIVIACLVTSPAIRQVETLGPWYAHTYHQLDYVRKHNELADYFDRQPVPAFYRELAARAPGSTPIIEAPFDFESPANRLARLASIHRQPETIGFLGPLCLDGTHYGEVPRDPRFRFRKFVYLDDPAAVRATGARYIALDLDQLHGQPFAQAPQCEAALARLYGPPRVEDNRLAVYDLGAEKGARKIQ